MAPGFYSRISCRCCGHLERAGEITWVAAPEPPDRGCRMLGVSAGSALYRKALAYEPAGLLVTRWKLPGEEGDR